MAHFNNCRRIWNLSYEGLSGVTYKTLMFCLYLYSRSFLFLFSLDPIKQVKWVCLTCFFTELVENWPSAFNTVVLRLVLGSVRFTSLLGAERECLRGRWKSFIWAWIWTCSVWEMTGLQRMLVCTAPRYAISVSLAFNMMARHKMVS